MVSFSVMTRVSQDSSQGSPYQKNNAVLGDHRESLLYEKIHEADDVMQMSKCISI